MAKEVWKDEGAAADAKTAFEREMLFPIGNPNDAFAQYFIGKSYLAPVSTEQVKMYNVTFEPGWREALAWCCRRFMVCSPRSGSGWRELLQRVA